jgi:hypothetical protein
VESRSGTRARASEMRNGPRGVATWSCRSLPYYCVNLNIILNTRSIIVCACILSSLRCHDNAHLLRDSISSVLPNTQITSHSQTKLLCDDMLCYVSNIRNVCDVILRFEYSKDSSFERISLLHSFVKRFIQNQFNYFVCCKYCIFRIWLIK